MSARVLLLAGALVLGQPLGVQAQGSPDDAGSETAPDDDALPEGFVEVPLPTTPAPTRTTPSENPPPPEGPPAPSGPPLFTLVLSGTGGYWGLKASTRDHLRASVGWGARAELDLKPWLTTELWGLTAAHTEGTSAVSSRSRYATLALSIGGQQRLGSVLWAGGVGVAGTRTLTEHRLGGTVTESIAGNRLGLFWSLGLKWRAGPLEVRADLASIWRGPEADLLALASVGWVVGLGQLEASR